MIWFFIAAICLIFVAVVFIVLRERKYRKFILENSVTLGKLREVNDKYHFFDLVNYDMSNTYDNQDFYNDISCLDYLTYQLQFKKKEISEQIFKAEKNRENYRKYRDEIKSINEIGAFRNDTGKLNKEKLIKTEKKICNKTALSPSLDYSVKVTLYCSKINGRKYEGKSQIFSSDDILFIISKGIDDKIGQFYKNKDVWDSICRVERGKVSNAMRFSIYKRDGYRCRMCGISDRFANLEVDHIIPISKGGKSTYDNLQTLCHRCNVQKGNSMPYKKH